ncbi:peptide/nickel transport system ATP-binding protein [Serratia fonticola]|uniref:Peptide/nickel transport system ATP-binding protein n=1 Tax=Serratia fonticola TaxID=47917 RepID=A0A559T9U5_SERFO|nr:ATP-binding cassette domain-containing protein [Serratia fonticola]TQI81087.1 peptide/nickel transport system ATP-binding protein [Serratia fonticola]TQI96889.1 peptide/nickel transport system ATP-binding protein [Serratia fonticola]TVZ71384.1 peptide/nickel transport system ATP-binding protein [Serratia fonticola]
MLKFEQFSIEVAHYRWLGRKTWHPLLSDISLEVQPGELVALVGGSGEGKSLLLQSALGLLPDNMRFRGQISLDGKVLTAQSQIEQRGKTLCYVPQGVSALNPLIKVGSQLTRAAQLSGVKLRLEEVALQLQSYNLAPGLMYDFPRKLSGGMAKRVLASCATLTQARYILADEVTSWLDDEHACQLLTHLKANCQQGRGILWVTHDLALAARFADKIVVLHKGGVHETLTAEALKNNGGSPWLRLLWAALPEQEFIAGTPTSSQGKHHA